MKYARLSASLAALLDDYQNQGPHALLAAPRAVPLSSDPTGLAPVVTVFVRCKDRADLSDVAGAQVHQATGKLRTARVSLDRVEDLADHSGVSRVAAARLLRPLD